MSQSSVQNILKLIDNLSDVDREILQQELALRAETQWRQEAEAARREAKSRGIDQSAIDKAIGQMRYGS